MNLKRGVCGQMDVSPKALGVFEQCLSIYSILGCAVIKSEKGPKWEVDLLGDGAQFRCNFLICIW